MCSLFGDPHIRSFDNKFQTCMILGAWPMVDHPLFAVQVMNSRSSDPLHLVSGLRRWISWFKFSLTTATSGCQSIDFLK